MDSKNSKPRKKSITASIQKAATKSLDKIEKLITGTNNNKEIITKNIVEDSIHSNEYEEIIVNNEILPNPYDEFSSVYENYSFDDEKYLYSDLATFRTPKLRGPKLKSEEILDVTGKKHALKRHYWFILSTGCYWGCFIILNPIYFKFFLTSYI